MFDVIIVGGGLAGCSAAIQLAQYSHHVALIEANTYPRPKVCGEFLSPESAEIFRQLDFLSDLQGLNPTTIRTVRITASDNYEWHGELPTPALGISRYSLDEALINHAQSCGVKVYTNTRVTNIIGGLEKGFELNAQSSRGRIKFTTQSVIVAHGKHGNLDRKLNRNFPRKRKSYIGLKQHFQGERLFEHIDLHTFPGGYCGISQVENDRTNVCMLVDALVFKKATGDSINSVEQFIDWLCDHNRELARWIATAIPLYPNWLTIGGVTLAAKRPVEREILFVGDASGMIAPLAGDGMAMALHSGLIAAYTLNRYLLGKIKAATTLHDYETIWSTTFQTRLRLGRLLQSLMQRQSIIKPGLQLMNTFPALGNWLITNTRDMKLLD